MPQTRMEAAYAANPNIGRVRLQNEAGVSQLEARVFLAVKRNGQPVERSTGTVNELRKQVRELTEKNRELSAAAELINSMAGSKLTPPAWLAPSGRMKDRAIATAFLSDTHYDEVVDPTEINGVNAYNRQIAELRTKRFFENAVKLGRDYFGAVRIEGLVLALGGDIVTGNIHEELQQTNEAYILETCLYWPGILCAGIEMLLSFYPRIFIPAVVGNHGRLTKKPRHKGRVKDNFDYLIYKLIEKHFQNDERVSFLIPDSTDASFTIYNTRYCLTHGDQFRGGTGIAGALSPLLLGDSRKRKRNDAVNNGYDYLMVAHWHQDIDTNGIIVNNSLKGYDEFAANNNFQFSKPTQAFWLTDPEHGRTLRAPIHVVSDDEDWGACVGAEPGWLKAVGAN